MSLAQSQGQPPKSVDLKDIHRNFLRYEGKVVTLVGFLKGSHIGTFIESQDHDAIIRLRFAQDLRKARPGCSGRLYRRFEDVATSMYAPAIHPEPRAAIEVRGLVSVLRRDGKLARSYDPYREAPVEFVPIQVLRFEPVRRPVVHPE